MVSGLQLLRAYWRQFSGALEIYADILQSSPVFFHYKTLLISKMMPLRNSNRHVEMADIRARARQVYLDVVALQGWLEEAEMKVPKLREMRKALSLATPPVTSHFPAF